MAEQFPVNAGNVPLPPSQSIALLPHQLNLQAFQNASPANSQPVGPGLRRKHKDAPPNPNLKLERILGLTTTSPNVLATAESQDLIAYAAGAVVVLYNHKRNKQVGFLYPHGSSSHGVTSTANVAVATPGSALVAPLGGMGAGDLMASSIAQGSCETDEKKSISAGSRAKPISCLAFSPDGNYLAAGEMGHQPRILIWSIKDRLLLHECRAHKFGVLSLAFSPRTRYLVSVGFQHDGYVYVWNWRKGTKLAGNKVTSKVNALAISRDGTYFVTAGLRHVKYWYFDKNGRLPKRENLSSRETQLLDGRSGVLGALRQSNFVAAACDKNHTEYTYFITENGILCVFKEGRVIDKWVDLQVKNAYSISVSSDYVMCAAAGGVVRVFETVTLRYLGALPKPHPLGIDISAITSPDMVKHSDESMPYPDALAIRYDGSTKKATVVYADRSLYMWDASDLKMIGKYRSFIAHSDCVWGVEPYPIASAEDASQQTSIPPCSFATYSADGTVRFWNLDLSFPTSLTGSLSPQTSRSDYSNHLQATSPSSLNLSPGDSTKSTTTFHRRNIYSRELIKMIYVDTDAAEFSKYRRYFEIADEQGPDFGIRSLKMSSDGKLLATGDRNGNLRVHDMETWEQLTYQEAHDSEILDIDFTHPNQDDSPYLVATASRDRLLHIFDIRRKFQLVQSMDDHSSSITAVRFSQDAKKLISCGADKGIIFRKQVADPVNPSLYSTYHNHSGRSTVFDMSVDVNGRYIATVTGERRLFVLSIESGKPFRTCKPETAEEIVNGASSENAGGSLINIDLDPFSGTYAVTSGSDRCVRLFDLTNSTCIDRVCAHAELITSVKFLQTAQEKLRIVSTCSDGTVFVWKVNEDLLAKMKARGVERSTKIKQVVSMGALAAKAAVSGEGRGESRERTRLRRVSTAGAMINPTASLSQMVRQGERKTFSTMSLAEQKHDDIYKKLMTQRRGRDNLTIQVASNRDDSQPPSSARSPLTPSEHNTTKSPMPPAKTPIEAGRLTLLKAGEKPSRKDGHSSQRSIDMQAKVERLHNGIAPALGREGSAYSAYTPSLNGNGPSRPMDSPRTPIHHPPSPSRMNQVIRRQWSRDTLNTSKQDASKTRSKNTEAVIHKRPHGRTIASKRQSDSGLDMPQSPVTSEPIQRVRSARQTATTLRKSPSPSPPSTPSPQATAVATEDSDRDSPVPETPGRGPSNDGEDDEEDDEEEGEEGGVEIATNERDEEEEEEEEEEMIFIASPPDRGETATPFMVSTHQLDGSQGVESSHTEDRQTPVSDNDTPDTDNSNSNSSKTTEDNEEEEERSSGEENVDDAIIRAIMSPKMQKMPSPLSRNASMKMPKRQSANLDTMAAEIQHSLHALAASPSADSTHIDETEHGLDAQANDTETLHGIQKKLTKARKRQSITARYLSSRKGHSRESLEHLLDDVATSPMEPLPMTIPVALERLVPESPKGQNYDTQPTIAPAPQDTPSGSSPVPSNRETKVNKIDPIMSDLERAQTLIEGALASFDSLRGTAKVEPEQATKVETKLQLLAGLLPYQSQSNDDRTPDDATLKLLDDYSTRLLRMVEAKAVLQKQPH